MKIKAIFLVSFVVLLVLFSGCFQKTRAPNPALCERISLQQNKDICYHRVAITKDDSILCSKIADLSERDNCYMDLAVGRTYYAVD